MKIRMSGRNRIEYPSPRVPFGYRYFGTVVDCTTFRRPCTSRTLGLHLPAYRFAGKRFCSQAKAHLRISVMRSLEAR